MDIDPLDNPKLEDKLGGLRRSKDGSVFHVDKSMIINSEGFAKHVSNSKQNKTKSEASLWRAIGPLRYGDIVLKKNTKCWYKQKDTWIQAKTIDICEDGEPVVLFKIENTSPREYIKLFGSDIANLVKSGDLQSQDLVSSKIESELGLD